MFIWTISRIYFAIPFSDRPHHRYGLISAYSSPPQQRRQPSLHVPILDVFLRLTTFAPPFAGCAYAALSSLVYSWLLAASLPLMALSYSRWLYRGLSTVHLVIRNRLFNPIPRQYSSACARVPLMAAAVHAYLTLDLTWGATNSSWPGHKQGKCQFRLKQELLLDISYLIEREKHMKVRRTG